jgi:tellurite resistance protein
MTAVDKTLLERVARSIARPATDAPSGVSASILTQSAASYGVRPVDETIPTGFDPSAAALFEAVVEAAFLVANSDGVFDDDERRAFQSVVAHACNNAVQTSQLEALVADLCEQLAEDGVEKRARMVARTIRRRDQQLDVLRIAALMAHISGGVSEQERSVLDELAKGFEVDSHAVNHALDQAESALKGG